MGQANRRDLCSCMGPFHAFLMHMCIVSFFLSPIGALVHYMKNGNI